MKSKILITGINGFLGSHLANYLKETFEVIGLEHQTNNLHRLEDNNFTVYDSNEVNLDDIFKKHSFYAVLHVATVYRRQGEPILDLVKTNLNLPVCLVELSIKYEVKLYLNTDSFFNDIKYSYSYLSDYTLSKKQALEWTRLLATNTPVKVVNMKIFHMYGKNDAPGKFIPFLITKIKNNEPSLDLTDGLQTRDFIYVEDVASAFEKVLMSYTSLEYYQEFEVGTGLSHSIKELATIIKDFTNSRTVLCFGAIPHRKGEIMNSCSNNEGLLALGWKPKFDLISALKKLCE